MRPGPRSDQPAGLDVSGGADPHGLCADRGEYPYPHIALSGMIVGRFARSTAGFLGQPEQCSRGHRPSASTAHPGAFLVSGASPDP